jgi:hypothetical protein
VTGTKGCSIGYLGRKGIFKTIGLHEAEGLFV